MFKSLQVLAAVTAALIVIAQGAAAATFNQSVLSWYTVNDTPAGGFIPPSVGGYDFSGETLEIVASGTACNGGCSNGANYYSANGHPTLLVENLPAFALIGRWGSSSNYGSAYSDAFFVGTALTVDAPTSQAAFLFLGYNDNYFGDNGGIFSVSITSAPTATAVPLPAAGWLLIAGLGMGAIAARRKARLQP